MSTQYFKFYEKKLSGYSLSLKLTFLVIFLKTCRSHREFVKTKLFMDKGVINVDSGGSKSGEFVPFT